MPREIHPYAVLLRPIITEKTTVLTGSDKYVFEVDLRANKNQIREAVQVAFNVRVSEVNTMVMKGKPKRFGRNQGTDDRTAPTPRPTPDREPRRSDNPRPAAPPRPKEPEVLPPGPPERGRLVKKKRS